MDMKWRESPPERKAGKIKVYSGDLEGDLAG